VLPFFSGFVVDAYGARNCIVAFISIAAIGHIVFSIGVASRSWHLMFLGRAIFGIGDGSNSVANLSCLSSWFSGRELAFALALNLSFSRMGSVVNNLVSPAIAMHSVDGVVECCWTAAFVIVASVVSAVTINILDHYISRINDVNHTETF
jgi:nitrate/nitrite transporter NarK